ncbi:MAG: hypothetical protein JW889_02020 [Verrucomicrobia bacterium]|nr:hypothetical protein [Verrucomicrobiota bacterium]
MNARMIRSLAVACCMLCGCETYRYAFDTTIGDDGSVERTVKFTHEKRNQEGTAKTGAEEPPNRGLPENLVIPDQTRFERFEWLENGFVGTWRSKGEIESDFRMKVKAYTPHGTTLVAPLEHPGEPQETREAYNDGAVTVTDLVLVKVYTYAERFHDYYSRREFEKHGDLMLDLLAGVFLSTLHQGLGEQYDFTAFDQLARETLLPLVKEWKVTLYAEVFVGQGPDRTLAASMPADRLALMNELVRDGVLDDPFADTGRLFGACGDWMVAALHDTVKDRKTGEGWPVDEIRRYFENDPATHKSPFTAGSAAVLEKRYATGDESEPLTDLDLETRAMYQSFGNTSDTHLFTIALQVPGTVVYATPKPQSALGVGGLSSVKWTFDDSAFFPDGVTLGLVTAVPDQAAQAALLGRTALTDAAQHDRYIAIVQGLGRQRDDVLGRLRAAVEEKSLTSFAEYARGQLPADWNRDAEIQPPLGELLLLLESVAAKNATE